MPDKPTRDDVLKQPPKVEHDKPPAEPMPENDPEALIEWAKRHIQSD